MSIFTADQNNIRFEETQVFSDGEMVAADGLVL